MQSMTNIETLDGGGTLSFLPSLMHPFALALKATLFSCSSRHKWETHLNTQLNFNSTQCKAL